MNFPNPLWFPLIFAFTNSLFQLPSIQLIIEAVRGRNFRGDIAIDEVGFNKGFCGKQVRMVKAGNKSENSK